MRLVGYIRVSTEEQATEGVSLQAQREQLAAYARLYGHELVAVVEDAGISAKSTDRPGLRRVLKMLRERRVDGLLVTKIDRLTRSVADLARMVDRFFTGRRARALLSVAEQIDTNTATGRTMLSLLGVFAEWERLKIGERTREALHHKMSRGAQLGAVPLGFKREGDRFIEDPAEQLVLARVRELAASGAGPTAIARHLAADGLATKRGGAWDASTVLKILRRIKAASVGGP